MDDKDPTEMHGVLVSHRSLLKFLNSHVVSTTTIACASLGLLMSFHTDADICGRYMRESLYDHLCLHWERRRGGRRPHFLHSGAVQRCILAFVHI